VARLGLFPLNIVLLPGEQVPLHIFEPRYKLLFARVLQAQEEVGINLLLNERLYEIGCRAQIVELLRHYPDGRMDVLVLGTHRYRVLELNRSAQPYLLGTVEWLEDRPEPVEEHLRTECQELYQQLVLRLRGESSQSEELFEQLRQQELLSFWIAQQVGLEPLQRQYLLELLSENERLQWLVEHLRAILPRLEAAEEFFRRVRSNGHFAP